MIFRLKSHMIYELENTSLVEDLFGGWEETLILSCLQKVMGRIFVTDPVSPRSAMAAVGCFVFLAGEPDPELAQGKSDGFVIMVPQNKAWAEWIESSWPDAKRTVRCAIKKDTRFDTNALQRIADSLPPGYEIKRIDAEIYDLCLKDPVTADFVSAFGTKDKYLELGRGVVILKNGKIVSGTSSYTRYREGIEIEVDTALEERREGLASIASANLILDCLKEGLYPSWDAQNLNSVRMAEKLGYEFSHEYIAYEVSSDCRTH